MKTEFRWIESAAQLRQLADSWLQCDAIAIDTEFMRTDTFYPIAALIQIGDGDNTYLLDPLAITELSPLAEVLTAPQVIKIFHACSEDLEVFQRLLGVMPQPLYDTQIAAAMLGEGFSVGYAGLMKALLDVDIPKGETRSNWLRRPLTDSQCLYAAMDVSYLFEGFKLLFARGEQCGRNDWVLDEGERMLDNQRYLQRSDCQYLKVKSAWKLSAVELHILMQLCELREQRVRKLDIPRSRWLKDGMLWDIAKRKPKRLAELSDIQGIPASFVRNNGDSLLALVQSAMSTSAEQLPQCLPKPLGSESAAVIKRLRAVATEVAEQQQMAVELLLKKKDIEQCIRVQPKTLEALPANLQGWRAALFGDALIAAL
ncbi:ribonuclease D [Sinobacterium caligoides]|uniref:Ribonuclease D n=1 Tax=Sinobacterium caligoides TaxID=933926 RepID=A0A3N2DKL8_9GAMM|nr:ribonuclease D [Sinobacterium caligoides]ROS00340.1 ribonuclease D [Sinobacterium caligoides]